MKRVSAIVLALSLLALGFSAVGAQPNVMIYFDENFFFAEKDCPPGPPGSISDSAYVVANRFGMWMSAIQFKVAYPAQMSWTGDVPLGGALVIGNSSTGIALAWPTPQNAFGKLAVLKIRFDWNCNGCTTADIPLVVDAHPYLGPVLATRWPDGTEFTGIGMTSLVCATVSNEETSWGRIKALFAQE